MRSRMVAVGLLCAGLALDGCGSGSSSESRSGSARRTSSSTTTSARSSPGAASAVPAAWVRVVRGWSHALLHGDVAAAARYFALPSIFYIGVGPPVRIRTRREAVAANEALTCGARFVSARRDGPYLNVRFQLVKRAGPGGGSACGAGVGAVAHTNFLIRGGRIVQWVRAPDTTPRPSPAPGPSTTTTSSGPVV